MKSISFICFYAIMNRYLDTSWINNDIINPCFFQDSVKHEPRKPCFIVQFQSTRLENNELAVVLTCQDWLQCAISWPPFPQPPLRLNRFVYEHQCPHKLAFPHKRFSGYELFLCSCLWFEILVAIFSSSLLLISNEATVAIEIFFNFLFKFTTPIKLCAHCNSQESVQW